MQYTACRNRRFLFVILFYQKTYGIDKCSNIALLNERSLSQTHCICLICQQLIHTTFTLRDLSWQPCEICYVTKSRYCGSNSRLILLKDITSPPLLFKHHFLYPSRPKENVYRFSFNSIPKLTFDLLRESFVFLYINHTTHNSSIRSDEGLTRETSASESLYGGQFTLSTTLIKPHYLYFQDCL